MTAPQWGSVLKVGGERVKIANTYEIATPERCGYDEREAKRRVKCNIIHRPQLTAEDE